MTNAGTGAYPNMKMGGARQYRYRKHLRWGQYVLPVFFGLGAAAPWGAYLLLQHIGSPAAAQVFVFAPVLSATFLIAGVPCWWMYYRLAGVVITLEDDALVYRYRGGTKRFPYDRLRPLRFPSVRYAGGWVVLRSGGDTIRLTVVVEGIGNLLQELKAALDARDLSDCYDQDQLYSFLKTAEYADQSWQRAYAVYWVLLLATLAWGALGAVLGSAAGAHPLAVVGWATVSALWPTGVYLGTEIVFGRRVAKLSDEVAFTCPPRDREWERAVYCKAVAWGLGSYLLSAALAFAATWHWFGR
jgi:hypothetical protein